MYIKLLELRNALDKTSLCEASAMRMNETIRYDSKSVLAGLKYIYIYIYIKYIYIYVYICIYIYPMLYSYKGLIQDDSFDPINAS